jgi:hypothetical protein
MMRQKYFEINNLFDLICATTNSQIYLLNQWSAAGLTRVVPVRGARTPPAKR